MGEKIRDIFTSTDNSSSNGTINSNQTETSLTPIQIFSMVSYCVIFVLGVTANGLVIYVTGFRMKTTVNSVWFLNLALADLLSVLLLIFYIISIPLNYRWLLGDFICKMFSLANTLNMFASIFLLIAISLDRCLSVWVVVWAQNKRTPRKARLICVFVWLFALLSCIPSIIWRRINKGRCVKVTDPLTNKRLAMFHFVVGFLIPFLIIASCYVAIAVRACQTHGKKKKRPFLVILAVILAFFICWLPIHIINLIMTDQEYIYSTNKDLYNSDLYYMAHSFSPVASIFTFLNSCINPFLYIFLCEEFQLKLKRSVFLVLEHAFAE